MRSLVKHFNEALASEQVNIDEASYNIEKTRQLRDLLSGELAEQKS